MPANPIKPTARHTSLTRNVHLLLALVFLLALGMRVGHWWGQRQHNPFFAAPIMDEQKHHEWAASIAAGQGLPPPFAGRPFFRAPLYYYLLAGLYKLVGPNIALARLAGCLLGAATCYLIARLGATLAGPRAGLVAGLLAAVYWPLVVFDGQLLTVGLELFLNVLLLWVLLLAVRKNSPLLFVTAGVIWGLAALTRPNILLFAPVVVFWLWLIQKRRSSAPGHPPRKPAAKSVAAASESALFSGSWRLASVLFLVAGAATISPVTIHNRVVGGEWVLIASSGGVNFYIGNNPQSDGVAAIVPGTRADWDGGYIDTHRIPERELGRTLKEGEVSDYWYRRAWTWIRTDPPAWLRLLWLKFRLSWSPVELYNNQPTYYFARLSPLSAVYWVGFPAVACLGIAALVLRGREWRTWSLPLLYGALYLGTVVAFFTCDRYRLPFVPVLMLLAAYGLTCLPELWRSRRIGRLGAYVAVGGLTGAFLATNPPDRTFYFRAEAGQAHHCLGVHYAQFATQQPAMADQAVEQLREAMRLRPGDTVMQLSVADLLQQAGRPGLAEQQLREVLGREPQNAAALQQYASFLVAGGENADAAAQYAKLLAMQPDDADGHANFGLLLARLKRFDEARAELQRGLELGSDSLDARLQLAFILAGRGDYPAALAQFDAILQQKPTDVTTLLNSAAALGRMGRYAEAAERYRRVLQVDPGNADAAGALEHTLQRLEATAIQSSQPAEAPAAPH